MAGSLELKTTAILVTVLVILTVGCERQTESTPEHQAAVVAPLAPFNAERFEPEAIDDVENWSWPSMEEFLTKWEAVQELTTPTMVIGDVRIKSVDGPDCRAVEEKTFPDAIVGIYESDDGAKLFVPHEAGSSSIRYPYSLGGTYRSITALQETTTMAHYRSDCREVFISPRHIFVGRPIAPNYLGDRAYARTLLTFGEPVFDEDYPLYEDEFPVIGNYYWNPFVDDDAPEVRRQRFRRFMPEPECGYSGASPYTDLYGELCAKQHDTSCFVQLSHLSHLTFRRPLTFTDDDIDHFAHVKLDHLAASPVDAVRFVLGMALEIGPLEDESFQFADQDYFLAPWKSHSLHALSLTYLTLQNSDRLAEPLQRWAQDRDLDAYNRLRATVVLFRIGTRNEDVDFLKGLELDELSRFWLEHYSEDDNYRYL